jgi:hypothetical protein
MKKGQKVWSFKPEKPPKPKVSDKLKIEVETKARDLIESFLKPTHIIPPPEDERFSYVVRIYSGWYRNFFYFYAKYHCRAPNCFAPFFETKFTRMEYAGKDLFNLSYMRHTEKWFKLYNDLSLEECLAAIKDEPHFLP